MLKEISFAFCFCEAIFLCVELSYISITICVGIVLYAKSEKRADTAKQFYKTDYPGKHR